MVLHGENIRKRRSTINLESFSRFGSYPFTANESILNEERCVFQLQLLDIFSKRLYYLGVSDEFAVGFCISVCLNHCLCVSGDFISIGCFASPFINNAIEKPSTDQKSWGIRAEMPDLRDLITYWRGCRFH